VNGSSELVVNMVPAGNGKRTITATMQGGGL
jgi:hypothetical protein